MEDKEIPLSKEMTQPSCTLPSNTVACRSVSIDGKNPMVRVIRFYVMATGGTRRNTDPINIEILEMTDLYISVPPSILTNVCTHKPKYNRDSKVVFRCDFFDIIDCLTSWNGLCVFNSDKISKISGTIVCKSGYHMVKICGKGSKSNTCVEKCELNKGGASLSPYLGSYKNKTLMITLVTNYQNIFGTSKFLDA